MIAMQKLDPKPSRTIPEGVKREVRQRCFFGCIVCGMPIFEYDHVTPFAEVMAHEPDNLVLLCPNHHRDKTAGRLPIDRLEFYKANPHNSNREFSSIYRAEPTKGMLVNVSQNIILNPIFMDGYVSLFQVNGIDAVALYRNDGWISLSFTATDDKGNIILKVDKGEMVINTNCWDFRYEGNNILVHTGFGQKVLEAFWSEKKFVLKKMTFIDCRDGSGLRASPECLDFIEKGRTAGQFVGNYTNGITGLVGLFNKEIFERAGRVRTFLISREF